MIQLRPGSERGRSKLGWLDSYHTFSFDRYYDPKHMSFRHLRVLNEDWVEGGQGFGMHPHRDMEIVTYVLEGALEHRDSLGNGGVIRPGEVQRMSAGRGITHSEFNASPDERVHLLQIWIVPARLGADPGYEQKTIPIETNGALRLIAAPDGRDGAVTIHQDTEVYAARLQGGAEATHALKPGRHAWVQVARGGVMRPGEVQRMSAGRGITHSEFNASLDERVHLLQIWIMPERLGLEPGYEQKTIPTGEGVEGSNGALRLIASPDGRDGAVTIHQDTEVYAARLQGGAEARHALQPGRHAWVQVARGGVTLNGVTMNAGDGAAVSQEEKVTLRANEKGGAELLLFDLS